MTRLLGPYHTPEFNRGAAFPIGRPGKHPVEIVEEIDEIFMAILQILNTRRGERVMFPEFGSDIGPLLWEPNDPFLQQQVRHELSQALAVWEPRVHLISVEFANSTLLENLGILVMSLSIQLMNNPRLTQVVQVPVSSQGRLFSRG